ncbi:unnamed protein product [Sphenostylis stenocarpa]|uniref:Uncharacterized protein n=1 Tax=Sphenostylis stenocarpa TaxID=92480 RepID=A0AA86VZS9_9FABA|nr:unnamed protein product [Sphenostylis stenocarpa]
MSDKTQGEFDGENTIYNTNMYPSQCDFLDCSLSRQSPVMVFSWRCNNERVLRWLFTAVEKRRLSRCLVAQSGLSRRWSLRHGGTQRSALVTSSRRALSSLGGTSGSHSGGLFVHGGSVFCATD